ncbi:unnamed protein product [Cunninghamella echinulata]
MEYSSGSSDGDPTFWRLCDGNNKCYCDFRLTITHCEQSKALHDLNIVDIVWSGFATLVAVAILYWRIKYRNQQFFDFSGKYPRPKPIESMGLFGVLFNLARIIHASVLITDVAKNPYFRAIMFELPWEFGISALSCYLFGVVYTLNNTTSATNRHIYTKWVKSQKNVDIICIVMTLLPFVTINPLAAVSAYYAQQGDTVKATIWTDALYGLWITYTFVLGSLILFAGVRLLNLLKAHLLTQGMQMNANKIRLGATKLKIIVGIACFCLWAFTIMIIIYVSSRYNIMASPSYSIGLACLALFNGPLATSIVEIALLLNIDFLKGLEHISFGSSGDTQSKASKLNNQSRKPSNFSELNSQELTSMNTVTQTEQWNTYFKDSGAKVKSYNQYESNNSLERKHSQLGHSLSSYAMNDLPTPNSVQTMVASENDDTGYQNNISKVEEEQYYYNSMTNQVRQPPLGHSNYNYTMNQHPFERRVDGDDSISSEILDNASLSNAQLVDPHQNRH